MLFIHFDLNKMFSLIKTTINLGIKRLLISLNYILLFCFFLDPPPRYETVQHQDENLLPSYNDVMAGSTFV